VERAYAGVWPRCTHNPHELAIPVVSPGESLGMSIELGTVTAHEQARLRWSHRVASAFFQHAPDTHRA
jgi:hypothetical protein